jgi:8-oxo-dGTP diphosphatase
MTRSGIAAKAFIVKEDKLLIIKRSLNDVHGAGMWEIPGGRLELDEDPIEGLKRETKEETEIDIEVLYPMNVQHFTREDGQKITMIIFLCKALNDKIKLSEEHSDFEWIQIERAKDKMTKFFYKEIDIYNKLELHKFL